MKRNSQLFALGFRPFYSLAAIFALASVLFWLLSFASVFHVGGYLQGIVWHSHEMVFGFAIAVMTGFLFTAVRNWTGLPTPTGFALAALAALWIAGRLLIITGPPLLAAVVDSVFVPALAIGVAIPVIKSRNQRNYKIVAFLLLLAITNVVYHLAMLGFPPAWLAYTAPIVALDLITMVFAIVAGRVIPAFTKNAIPGSDPRHMRWLEVLSFGSLALIVVLRISGDWVSISAVIPTIPPGFMAAAADGRQSAPVDDAGCLFLAADCAFSEGFGRKLAGQPRCVDSRLNYRRRQRAHARNDDAQRVGAHGSAACGQWTGYVGLPAGAAGGDYSCDSRVVSSRALPGAGYLFRRPVGAGIQHFSAALFADADAASYRRTARLVAGAVGRPRL